MGETNSGMVVSVVGASVGTRDCGREEVIGVDVVVVENVGIGKEEVDGVWWDCVVAGGNSFG